MFHGGLRKVVVVLVVSCFSTSMPLFGQSGVKVRSQSAITIGTSVEISSEILHENRRLNIYLPDGYNSKDSIRYNVIYLLDGGTDEDFLHVAGLVQFNSFSWIARIPPSIVVGVANIDRKRDFTFPTSIKSDQAKYPTTGGSANFISFLEKELQPYIKSNYKTSGSGVLIGESLAGLLATEVLLTKSYMFDKYIIISPSLWWDNGSLLEQSMAKVRSSKTKRTGIYIAVGKEGLTPTEKPRVMEVDANLLADKFNNLHSKQMDIYFDYLPDEDHATIAHQAIINAFRKLYTTK